MSILYWHWRQKQSEPGAQLNSKDTLTLKSSDISDTLVNLGSEQQLLH